MVSEESASFKCEGFPDRNCGSNNGMRPSKITKKIVIGDKFRVGMSLYLTRFFRHDKKKQILVQVASFW